MPRYVRTFQVEKRGMAQASGSNTCGMFEKNVMLVHRETTIQESVQIEVETGPVGQGQGVRIY